MLIDMLFSLFYISSPFLCVFGYDSVILYTGAHDATCDVVDAWDTMR